MRLCEVLCEAVRVERLVSNANKIELKLKGESMRQKKKKTQNPQLSPSTSL